MNKTNGMRIPVDVPLIGQQKQQPQPAHLAQPGLLAEPVVFPHLVGTSSGHAAVLTYGGLTKLEAAAIQIAAQVAPEHLAQPWQGNEGLSEVSRGIAVTAATIAEHVLIECARRQSPPHLPPQNPEQQNHPQE